MRSCDLVSKYRLAVARTIDLAGSPGLDYGVKCKET